MWWIITLSTQRLSATIILLWWDFLCELCNSNASAQITTRLLSFGFFPLLLYLLTSALSFQTMRSTPQRWNHKHLVTGRGGPTLGKGRCCHDYGLTVRCCCDARVLISSIMKYKKFITIMQAALGVAPLNKRELIPPPRKLWKPARWVALCVHVFVSVCVCAGIFPLNVWGCVGTRPEWGGQEINVKSKWIHLC